MAKGLSMWAQSKTGSGGRSKGGGAASAARTAANASSAAAASEGTAKAHLRAYEHHVISAEHHRMKAESAKAPGEKAEHTAAAKDSHSKAVGHERAARSLGASVANVNAAFNRAVSSHEYRDEDHPRDEHGRFASK